MREPHPGWPRRHVPHPAVLGASPPAECRRLFCGRGFRGRKFSKLRSSAPLAPRLGPLLDRERGHWPTGPTADTQGQPPETPTSFLTLWRSSKQRFGLPPPSGLLASDGHIAAVRDWKAAETPPFATQDLQGQSIARFSPAHAAYVRFASPARRPPPIALHP